MAAKRRLLPHPEEMLKEKKEKKSMLQSFNQFCQQLRGSEFPLIETVAASAVMPDIPEDHCTAWLVLKYGSQAVFTTARLY